MLNLLSKLLASLFIEVFPFFVFATVHTARGILVPRPGIEPVAPAVEAQSPNHWTAREVPRFLKDGTL